MVHARCSDGYLGFPAEGILHFGASKGVCRSCFVLFEICKHLETVMPCTTMYCLNYSGCKRKGCEIPQKVGAKHVNNWSSIMNPVLFFFAISHRLAQPGRFDVFLAGFSSFSAQSALKGRAVISPCEGHGKPYKLSGCNLVRTCTAPLDSSGRK